MTNRGQPGEIVAATGVDDTYLPLVWPLARSAARRLAPHRRITLHVLHLGTDEALAARLGRLRLPRLTVVLHSLGHRLAHLQLPGRLPPATYGRLLVPELVPDRRALYLDPDILVRADLGELFDTNLGACQIGGVPDVPQSLLTDKIEAPGFTGSWAEYCTQLLGLADDPVRLTYINVGVLLLDLERLRAERFTERALELAVKLRDTTLWHDQDVINVLGEGSIALLDAKWNVMPPVLAGPLPEAAHLRGLVERQRAARAVVHFAGSHKPWARWSAHAPAWWRAAAFSPAMPLGLARLRSSLGATLRRKAPRIFDLLRHMRRRPGHT